jgi:hypothetical protein
VVLVTGSAAIDGNQSLTLPPGADAEFHLERPSSSATHLRFDLLPILKSVHDEASVTVRAGVVGGKTVVYRSIGVPFSPVAPSNDDSAASGGADNPIIAVDLPLDESGGDVLLEIQTELQPAFSPPLELGAVVDRLRFE